MNTNGRWSTSEKETSTGAMSYAYGDEGPDAGISSRCLDEIAHGPVARASVNVGTRSSHSTIRDGLTYGDYQFYRPAEAMPRKQKEIIAAADESYQRIGLLHNVIDLMSDFGSQGIEIFHPNKTKQRRYRAWFARVNGRERSERFLNFLYRHGNVIIKKAYADLNVGDVDDLERGVAGRVNAGRVNAAKDPEDIPYERAPKVFKGRIPLQYTFINPTAVDVLGGELALFAGQPRYALNVPEPIIRAIKNPKTDDERRLVALLPEYITAPIRAGKKSIPLDPAKIEVYHYKKDDWQQWSNPMIYSILADLRLYEKNKLADMAALDGAVSHIRLWKLGLPEYKIQPGPVAFARLREQLAMVGAGGVLDLIWDATLDLKETSSDIYNFLGMKKYEPVLQAIYAGLGIPQALTGGKESGGLTSGTLSLKTLIERLQYGRDLLEKFWVKELMVLQEAFGDRNPARVHFDNMSLSDEANEKMLWLHLYDRDIISLDTIREKFGTIPEVETARVRGDYEDRDADQAPDKAGPYVDSQPDLALEKIALQTGVVSPKDVGLEKGADRLLDLQKEQMDLQAKQAERDHQLQKKQLDVQAKQGEDLHQQKLAQNDEVHQQRLAQKDVEHKAMLPIKKQAARKKLAQKPGKSGTPGQGRPGGARDSQKRKKRVDTPRTAASAPCPTLLETHAWAAGAYDAISEVVTPIFIKRCNKKSIRGLGRARTLELERIVAGILCSLEPGSRLDDGLFATMADDPPAPDEGTESLSAGLDIADARERLVTAYSITHSMRENK